jgi:hypothetical protein
MKIKRISFDKICEHCLLYNMVFFVIDGYFFLKTDEGNNSMILLRN